MSVVTGLSTAPKLCSLLTLKLIKFHQKIKKETDLHSLVLLRNKSREWVLRQFSAVFLSLQNLLFFILPSMNNNVSLSQGYWDASLGCSLLHPIRIIILHRSWVPSETHLVSGSLSRWQCCCTWVKLKASRFHSLLVTRKLTQFLCSSSLVVCPKPLPTQVWNGIK